ncbi:hypothetical protein HPB47_002685 [Ixodes persulcatus]|uniref:Uncharacterized protein n=1 Tax=Ixodes persulcatus TaxID=34615 RepID=A0AC60PKI6_IXOPE|nr:hypothetical protein HPB47_002685 [Ixodes persulcatus]
MRQSPVVHITTDEDVSKEPDEQPNGHFAQGESQPLHRKHVNSDSSEIREVASQFVSDLIYRAKEVAQRQQSCIEEEEEEEEDMPPPRRIPDLSAGPAKARLIHLNDLPIHGISF